MPDLLSRLAGAGANLVVFGVAMLVIGAVLFVVAILGLMVLHWFGWEG